MRMGCRPATSTHIGAGEPGRGVWRGVFGCGWIVATSTWVCVLAEGPPGDISNGSRLERRCSVGVMFDRVAGLDVGKESVTVCVRTPGPRGGRRSETRTFKTTTGSLRVMRDWLVEAGVTIAAMATPSTCWKAPFYCLEEVMVVWLLNA